MTPKNATAETLDPQKRDGDDDGDACTRVDAQQAGFCQRVARHCLDQRARHPQRRACHDGDQRARQAQFPHHQMQIIRRIGRE
nr:hypothetical protein [Ketogulonicigenium vulgare]